jgi:hypothetical protein
MGGDGGVVGRPCLDDLCLVAPSRGLANPVVQARMSNGQQTSASAYSAIAYSRSPTASDAASQFSLPLPLP